MPIFRDKFGNKNYVFLVLCVLLMISSTSYIFICASNYQKYFTPIAPYICICMYMYIHIVVVV